MNSVDQARLIVDITHIYITQVAPEELPIFQGVSEAYFENPNRFTAERAGKEDMLGFGVESMVVLATPVILTILTNVFASLTQKVIEIHAAKGWSVLKRKLRKPRATKKEASTIQLPLTAEQLSRVHELTLQEAAKLKLSPSNTALLADAVVGRLALTQAQQNP